MRAAAVLLLALTSLRCTPDDLVVVSPDGKHTARVRNEWSIDPPNQSLQVDEVLVAELGEDSDWCNTVVWSGDGSVAAFLVQDAKLIAVDAATHSILSTQWLVEQDGYPTSREVRALQLSEDGRTASFRSCGRRGEGCSEPLLVPLGS
jgi:hypothetical protein